LRVRPYIWYAERTKMRYDAVDRSFCDAIMIQGPDRCQPPAILAFAAERRNRH
jgi:hypothetical protein